jgi:hypothetical protein
MVKKRAGTFTISSITSDLDALTIRRDPQGTSGIQVGCTQHSHSHERSGISRIRRTSLRLDSLIIATAAYRPSHQL